MKRALIAVAAILGGLYLIGLAAGPPPPLPSRSETVERRCAEEFPNDATARTECFTLIAARDMERAKRAKVERAGR